MNRSETKWLKLLGRLQKVPGSILGFALQKKVYIKATNYKQTHFLHPQTVLKQSTATLKQFGIKLASVPIAEG